MYAVSVGSSEIGFHVARALLAAGHEVVVIEQLRYRCQLIADELGSSVVQGDGTDAETLKSTGVGRADIFIAVTNRDETNLVACQMAKHTFNVARTMAVIKDTKNEPLFHILGVDLVVNSTHMVVTTLEEGVPGRPLLHLMNLKVPDLQLVSISIPEDASVVGKRLDAVALPPHSFISLVVKGNHATLPSPDLIVEGLDEVVAVTMDDEEQTLYDILTGV